VLRGIDLATNQSDRELTTADDSPTTTSVTTTRTAVTTGGVSVNDARYPGPSETSTLVGQRQQQAADEQHTAAAGPGWDGVDGTADPSSGSEQLTILDQLIAGGVDDREARLIADAMGATAPATNGNDDGAPARGRPR
jgi:hypothetical protein